MDRQLGRWSVLRAEGSGIAGCWLCYDGSLAELDDFFFKPSGVWDCKVAMLEMRDAAPWGSRRIWFVTHDVSAKECGRKRMRMGLQEWDWE